MAEPIQAIRMPRWGMTMTEGTVAGWLVTEGAEIAPDQEVVEIETTKITNVMEAGYGGVLKRIVTQAGAVVPVGTLIAVVAEASVADADIDAFVEAHRSDAAAGGEMSGPAPRLVDAGGKSINVLSMGEGAAVPMVFIHGFGGDLNTWLFNQETLAAERPTHAVDLPAHGASAPVVGDGDIADLAAAVLATFDALDLERAHLVGHSLGGALALWLAATAPQRVQSLSLIAPAGLGPEIDGEYVKGFLSAERRRELKAVLGRLFADPARVSKDMIEGVQRFKRLDGVTDALGVVARRLFPEGRQAQDLRPLLADVVAPILVVWGADDSILPAYQAQALGETVNVAIVPDAGHMPHMEAAAAVNRLIAAHAADGER